MKPLVLDVFAGAGGFSEGFKLIGCEIIGAIEIDKWATETFAYNHPNSTVIQRDITAISDDDLKELFKNQKPTIVLGSPPCQRINQSRLSRLCENFASYRLWHSSN